MIKILYRLFSEKYLRYVAAHVGGIILVALPASMYLSERPETGNLFLPILSTGVMSGIVGLAFYRSLRYNKDFIQQIGLGLKSLLFYPITAIIAVTVNLIINVVLIALGMPLFLPLII